MSSARPPLRPHANVHVVVVRYLWHAIVEGDALDPERLGDEGERPRHDLALLPADRRPVLAEDGHRRIAGVAVEHGEGQGIEEPGVPASRADQLAELAA